MTQPAPPPPDGNGAEIATVLAAAATAYALIAVEARIREDVEQAIADAFVTVAALLTVALEPPR